MMRLTIGPMFADKTTSLIERARRTVKEKGPSSVVVLVPTIDTRSGAQLKSHSGLTCPASAVATPEEFQALVYPRPDLVHVLVDEVQFFGAWVVRELDLLSRRRLQVDASGLLHDYRGAPFENTAQLLLLAGEIIHKTATCHLCGAPATWTHRKPAQGVDARVLVGGAETYEARCREHWEEGVTDPWRPWVD